MIKDSPNPPGQPDFDTSTLLEVAYRAINHYLNPAKPIPEPTDGLFTVPSHNLKASSQLHPPPPAPNPQ